MVSCLPVGFRKVCKQKTPHGGGGALQRVRQRRRRAGHERPASGDHAARRDQGLEKSDTHERGEQVFFLPWES